MESVPLSGVTAMDGLPTRGSDTTLEGVPATFSFRATVAEPCEEEEPNCNDKGVYEIDAALDSFDKAVAQMTDAVFHSAPLGRKNLEYTIRAECARMLEEEQSRLEKTVQRQKQQNWNLIQAKFERLRRITEIKSYEGFARNQDNLVRLGTVLTRGGENRFLRSGGIHLIFLLWRRVVAGRPARQSPKIANRLVENPLAHAWPTTPGTPPVCPRSPVHQAAPSACSVSAPASPYHRAPPSSPVQAFTPSPFPRTDVPRDGSPVPLRVGDVVVGASPKSGSQSAGPLLVAGGAPSSALLTGRQGPISVTAFTTGMASAIATMGMADPRGSIPTIALRDHVGSGNNRCAYAASGGCLPSEGAAPASASLASTVMPPSPYVSLREVAVGHCQIRNSSTSRPSTSYSGTSYVPAVLTPTPLPLALPATVVGTSAVVSAKPLVVVPVESNNATPRGDCRQVVIGTTSAESPRNHLDSRNCRDSRRDGDLTVSAVRRLHSAGACEQKATAPTSVTSFPQTQYPKGLTPFPPSHRPQTIATPRTLQAAQVPPAVSPTNNVSPSARRQAASGSVAESSALSSSQGSSRSKRNESTTLSAKTIPTATVCSTQGVITAKASPRVSPGGSSIATRMTWQSGVSSRSSSQTRGSPKSVISSFSPPTAHEVLQSRAASVNASNSYAVPGGVHRQKSCDVGHIGGTRVAVQTVQRQASFDVAMMQSRNRSGGPSRTTSTTNSPAIRSRHVSG
eukprot:TRINITY_DN5363_c0_g1_i1.p1 TRINITY_DN5363_c0_g1~~TRINITY_DN5363_c0_g1_i1.p1  ORF type:complete len:738 (-),score=80.36 TRINITY_DN5363_c0_g1_i1:291-2504(-)